MHQQARAALHLARLERDMPDLANRLAAVAEGRGARAALDSIFGPLPPEQLEQERERCAELGVDLDGVPVQGRTS